MLSQVRAALERPGIDRDRAWIVGRGRGALQALDLLLENPGLLRRSWLLDRCCTPVATALGHRLAVSIFCDTVPAEAHADDVDTYADDVQYWLQAAVDWGDSVRLEPGAQGLSPELVEWWSVD